MTPSYMIDLVNRLAEFLRENGADPDIHELVIYPPTADPRCSGVHVLIPRADLDGTGRYPSRDEAVAKYPNRTI